MESATNAKREQEWHTFIYDETKNNVHRGSFGEVFKAKKKLYEGNFAIKKIDIAKVHRNISIQLLKQRKLQADAKRDSLDITIKGLLNEKNSSSVNNYDHIIKCDTCWFQGPNERIFNELHLDEKLPDDITVDLGGSSGTPIGLDFFYFAMEWCESDLKVWLEINQSSIDMTQVHQFWKDILLGLAELEKRHIIHRDIKPSNILLKQISGERFVAKIGDFGLSTLVKETPTPWQILKVGTENYKSPEMRDLNKSYDYKTDIFSAGITFTECLHVYRNGSSALLLQDEIYSSFKCENTPSCVEDRPEKYLISKMCEFDASERANASVSLLLLQEIIYEEKMSLDETETTQKYTSRNPRVCSKGGFNGVEGIDTFLLKFERKIYNSEGRFEGINYDSENFSNDFLHKVIKGKIEISEILKCTDNLSLEEREEILESACSIHHWILQGSLWWNPKTYSLPSNFIDRKVKFLSEEDEDQLPILFTEAIQNSGKFSWLIEPPGMGKSTVTTKLENEYRLSIKTNRIIVRINLNTIQGQLDGLLSSNEDNSSFLFFLKNFAPFIPSHLIENVSEETLKVILLLDGLDEISNENSEKMAKMLAALLQFSEILKDEDCDESFVSTIIGESVREPFQCEKIFLTTRPHLKSLIEDRFGFTSFALVPLEEEEQILFLTKEISTEFPFSILNAKNSILTLSLNSSELLGNPLFLYLFTHVIRDNYKKDETTQDSYDVFELYDRFVKSKHWLHVIVKEGQSPSKESTQIRVRHLLEENLPFYFEIASNQLHLDKSLLGEFLTSPDESKTLELLNYGLILTLNGKTEFVHRSFAEFICARYLISRKVSSALMNILFGVLMMEKLPNVEEFIWYGLRKRKLSYPGKTLLRLTKEWMKIDGKVQTRSLLHFINGILFSILCDEVLSSACDFNDIEVLDTIMKVSVTSYNRSLMNWIMNQDPQFVRCILLLGLPQIPQSKRIDWSTLKSDFITALLSENPHYIKMALSEMEIRDALHSSENIVSIVALDSEEFVKRKAAVEEYLSHFALIDIMLTKAGLEASLKSKEISWWIREAMHKSQTRFHFIYSEAFIKFLWINAEYIMARWGGDIYCGLLRPFLALADSCKPWDQFLSWDGYSTFAYKSVNIEELREISPRVRRRNCLLKNTPPLNLLNVIDREGKCNCVNKNFHDLFIHKSEKYENLDVRLLPYIIRYGGLPILKKSFRKFPKLTNTAWRYVYPQTLCDSLILSVVMDSQLEAYQYFVSLYSEAETTGDNYVTLLAPFFKMNPFDLRRVAKIICDVLEAEHLNVFQVSWGEIFLRLLANITPNEYIIKHAVLDFLRKSVSLEVSGLLNQVLQIMPNLKDYILHEVASEASIASNICHYYGTPLWDTSKKRFNYLIKFLLEVNGTELTWLPKDRIEDFLLGMIVNIHQYQEDDGKHSTINKFEHILDKMSDAILNTIEKREQSTFRSLLKLTEFWTGHDWSIVLLTLGVYKKESPVTFSKAFYEDPVTPLLWVWFHYFGKEETKKVAENEGIAIYKRYLDYNHDKYDDGPISGRHAAEFAVRLGSLKLLEAVASPNIISWTWGENNTSLLDISIEDWGTSHEITEFLMKKFNCSLDVQSVSDALVVSTVDQDTPHVQFLTLQPVKSSSIPKVTKESFIVRTIL